MTGTRIIAILKRHGWILNLLFIAIGAHFVAGAANAVVARSFRVVPSMEDVPADANRTRPTLTREPLQLEAIANRNLLGVKREVIGPVQVEEPEQVDTVEGTTFDDSELKPCTMPAELRATLVAAEAPQWSLAVVYDNTSREAQVYSINQGTNQITDDAVLVDVRDRAIVVRRRDHFELCSAEDEGKARPAIASRVRSRAPTPSDGGIEKVSESQYVVDRSEVDDALSNLSKVATQARIVPSFKNGKPNGFKLFSIKPGSIYSKIGLRNGDVIQKINGYEMNSPDKALELYQKLKDASNVQIELQRRGQTKNFSYSIQ